MIIVDPATDVARVRAARQTIADRESGNRDSFARTDVEDAAGVVAVYRETAGAQAGNVDTLTYQQLAGRECDHRAVRRQIEIDSVARQSVGNHLTQ